MHTTDGRDGRPTPYLRGFFGCDVPGKVILNAGVGGHGIRYPLSVWFSPASVACKAEENRVAALLAELDGESRGCPWYGVIVILKYGGRRCTTYIDITARDLMVFSAYVRDEESSRAMNM